MKRLAGTAEGFISRNNAKGQVIFKCKEVAGVTRGAGSAIASKAFLTEVYSAILAQHFFIYEPLIETFLFRKGLRSYCDSYASEHD